MTASTSHPPVASRRASRPSTRLAIKAAAALAAGALLGGGGAFVTTSRAGEPTGANGASPSASSASPSTSVATVTLAAPRAGVSDPRYPTAPVVDAETLARVGDLWRLESVTTFRDDAAPGPTAAYLVSPGGDRYLAGTVATPGLAVLAWDVSGGVALFGGPDFMGDYFWFRLDIATGVASPEDPPMPHESSSVSRFGVGADGRTYFGLGNFPSSGTSRTAVWAWSVEGWEELVLPASVDPLGYSHTDAIVTGGEWMLWAENTYSYPRTEHLLNLSTGIDSPLPSLGDCGVTDGWHDRTHLDVYCWPGSGGQGSHRLYDVSTGASSEAPDPSRAEDGYVYSSAQLPGTPLVFRYDDTPGLVSSISVLTKDGLKTLATVAPEDQFQIGDVIEVRSGTYVIRDGSNTSPGDEVVRAVIDVVSGFAAFGSPRDLGDPGPHRELRTTILVNFEGE